MSIVTCALVSQVVSERYGISQAQLHGPSRTTGLVEARQIAMVVAHRHGRPFTAIGRAMGRDHSSVIHAVRTIEKRAKDDPAVESEIEIVTAAARLSALAFARIGFDGYPDIDAEAVASRITGAPLLELNISVDELRAMALHIVSAARERLINDVVHRPEVAECVILPDADPSDDILKAAAHVAALDRALSDALYTDNEPTARHRRDRAIAALTALHAQGSDQ